MPSEFAPWGSKPRVTKQQIKEMQENYKKASELLKDTSEEEASEKAILDELFDEELENAFVVTKKIWVYIGRFQPLHKWHENILKQMIEDNDIVLVFIWVWDQNLDNPFSYDEVYSFFSDYKSENFIVSALHDRESNENWVRSFIENLQDHTDRDCEITIYWWNLEKDYAITVLKKYLPMMYDGEVSYIEIPRYIFLLQVDNEEIALSATLCRSALERKDWNFLEQVLPEIVYNILKN